ncbi:LOW QUALITY PROTEIN: transforming growth factor-beta-induced protein ig-h3-like [Uloborus diversus]|uniref:LOW QUALITY PROTEIN: transforming growth factor-beta-induced protein ig-h3-like n=1 Tax=Uloborus diversus TaxID=327109 RepID=UPI0024098CC7|nr:LOW QUALITY PROTEIN: transforming growth factor-beta-induced protein ig-h3-like [Uloborus diversus]
MAELVENSSWSDALHHLNYSLFCPPDDALKTLFKENTGYEVSGTTDGPLPNFNGLLKRHLLPGFVKAEDIPDGHLLQTEDPGIRVRINIYHIPEKVMTANCVPVVQTDKFARNGVIHLVEKVLPSPSKTVADLIAGDSQFSILKGIVSRAGLVQTLRNLKGSFTLFAPTDSAFAAIALQQPLGTGTQVLRDLSLVGSITHLKRKEKKLRFSQKHIKPNFVFKKTVSSLMRHHLLDHVICSSALPPRARSLSGSGELLSLTRDEHGKLYVDGVQVVVRDWMALNGVVHVIDGVLTTRQAKCASQVMEDSSLTMFLSLVEAAGLKNTFDTMEEVTFFIPADQALLQVTPSRAVKSLLRLNGSLGDALLYHVAKGRVQLNAPHQRIPSWVENATLRIHVQATFPHAAPQVLVQCATVLSPDNRFCGGTLYVIDRFLVPPKMTLVQLMERNEGFSTLVLLLRATGLDRRMLGNPDVPRTLLAPTDDAFHNELGEEGVLRMLENLDQVADMIRIHILPGAQCCSHLKGDFSAGRRRTRAIDGSLLALGRAPGGALLVGGARIVDCDVMATDGILQVVDTVVRHDDTVLG